LYADKAVFGQLERSRASWADWAGLAHNPDAVLNRHAIRRLAAIRNSASPSLTPELFKLSRANPLVRSGLQKRRELLGEGLAHPRFLIGSTFGFVTRWVGYNARRSCAVILTASATLPQSRHSKSSRPSSSRIFIWCGCWQTKSA